MNTALPAADFPPVANDLLAAMLRGDLNLASRLIEQREQPVILETAYACMRGRRWSDAAWLFDRISETTPAIQLQRCFAGNLASLQIHQPDVYQAIVTLPAEQRVAISASAKGHPTLVVTRGNGERVCLSPGNDPLANVVSAMRNLAAARQQGLPLALCGIGDGYLLQTLSRHPVSLFMDMQELVYVIEPDCQVLLHCLMIHDLTGPQGPIEQRRFVWFCGPTWGDRIQHLLNTDPCLPLPAITINQGLDSNAISAGLRDLSDVAVQRERRLKEQVEAYYADDTRPALTTLMSARPPRPPRVLLITTRFSTVLQYSTRDTAKAFENLGWEAKVLIEPSPMHRLLQTAIRRELAGFRPDLVFQLDHLRHEHGDLFPPSLPFVCWIQDHLPNLRTPQAGRSITANDFVLTDAPATYRSTFNYPERQCVALTKLTRQPWGVPRKAVPTEDLVFVSNASHIPQRLITEKLAGYGGTSAGRDLIKAACDWLLAQYAAENAVPTYYQLLRKLRDMQAVLKLALEPVEFDAIAAWCFHPLNDALYRQQALSWAQTAAAQIGLNLAIFGKGWENHPQFAAHARGPVEYGEALEQLTRAARFNLQIVPYHCLHQRLLDGLTAGGFYLVRRHPADTAASELLNFLLAHAPAAQTLKAARSIVFKSLRAELEALAEQLRPSIATTDSDDPVEAVRSWQEMGLVLPGEPVLPHLSLTSFDDATSLRLALTRFTADPELCQQVAADQRQSVLGRFTYEAGMHRLTQRMYELLSQPLADSQRSTARAAIAGQRLRRAI